MSDQASLVASIYPVIYCVCSALSLTFSVVYGSQNLVSWQIWTDFLKNPWIRTRFRILDENIINVFTDVWFGIRKSIPLADNKHCYVVVVVYLLLSEDDSAILTGFRGYKFEK